MGYCRSQQQASYNTEDRQAMRASVLEVPDFSEPHRQDTRAARSPYRDICLRAAEECQINLQIPRYQANPH